jgi:phosphatidylglycerol:prolipoprotein diacylglycerol transferase
MHPKLFDLPDLPVIGPAAVYTYGVLLAAAYLIGLRYAIARARTRGLDEMRVMDLGIYVIISALIGAKLMLVAVDFDQFRRNPSEILSLVRSGGVFYGGLILAVLVAFWFIRRHKLPFWTTCDVFAPGIALGHVIGRVGCLMAGCCFGRQTDVPWAITFTNPLAELNVGTPLGVPLHPTQLYEAGAELLILVALIVMERRSRGFPGRTFWMYILLYGVSRFVIEFYRGDPRGAVGALSTSQLISVILVPLSLLMLFRLRHGKPAPDPARASARRARAA